MPLRGQLPKRPFGHVRLVEPKPSGLAPCDKSFKSTSPSLLNRIWNDLESKNPSRHFYPQILRRPLFQSREYVTELFGNVASGDFDGKIDIVSSQPVVELGLRQRALVFTSLPVIP